MSHIRNDDISDLPAHIEKATSTRLSYSYWFWADQLEATAFEDAILTELIACMHFGFLYWLEVLSLLRDGDMVSQAPLSICGWCKVSPYTAIV